MKPPNDLTNDFNLLSPMSETRELIAVEVPRIHEQMVAIMGRVSAIGKNNRNAEQKYTYRGIQDVTDQLHYILAEEKVYLTMEVLERWRETNVTAGGKNQFNTTLRIKYTFHSGIDGSSVSAIGIGEGADMSDKSSNKAQSAALKYVLTQVFLIPFSEMIDGDAVTPEETYRHPQPHQQAAPAQQQNQNQWPVYSEVANLINQAASTDRIAEILNDNKARLEAEQTYQGARGYAAKVMKDRGWLTTPPAQPAQPVTQPQPAQA